MYPFWQEYLFRLGKKAQLKFFTFSAALCVVKLPSGKGFQVFLFSENWMIKYNIWAYQQATLSIDRDAQWFLSVERLTLKVLDPDIKLYSKTVHFESGRLLLFLPEKDILIKTHQ